MKSFIEWLEEDNKRLRKVLAVLLFIVWCISGIASYTLQWFKVDTIGYFGAITGLMATTLGFYMSTKASSDD